jgi:hypothetical protein
MNHEVTKTQSNTKPLVNLSAFVPLWFKILWILIVSF